MRTSPDTKPASLANQSPSLRSGFPIAGIGASAGGLEAFKELLSHTPINTGMAFVVIQHLDPRHESLSADILSRSTQMPVKEIEDGVQVQPNHVYVIPPNCNLGILHGVLKLLPRTETRGQHMPLDFFFQALAEDLKTQAIGVVLSGTASDGTQGLRAIKAEGGITLVQEPESAKYDGMPRSAIASGAVDLIRTPEGIADELARIAKHPYVIPKAAEIDQVPSKADENIVRIFSLLRNNTNVDFTHYKNSTIQRRIARRMLLQKTDDLGKYAKYLESHPDEIKALFADILIHVTGFFRDKKAFEALKTRILPKYMKNRDRGLPFRVWIPGCSTGEEAYSIAMTFMEFQDESPDQSKLRTPLSIFATDISEQALQKARTAIYPESISEDVSKERLRRFFERVDSGGYRIAKWLRDSCLFSRHDVTRDPPFAKVDLISCRNVLIYFDSELQRVVLPIFHYALNPDGILLLGKSETIGGFTNLFSLTDKINKVYSKNNITTPLKIQFPVNRYSVDRLEVGQKTSEPMPGRLDLQREFDRIAMSAYTPPCVLVNNALDIVLSRGRTGSFLELSTGHPNLNLLRMAHPELVADLRAAINHARKTEGPIVKEGLSLRDGGTLRNLTIQVVPVPTARQSKERYFAIFFEETEDQVGLRGQTRGKTRADAAIETKRNRSLQSLKDKHHLEMQKKFSANQEYQQSLIEEYETSQEELVSSNEELQSTNEELQSTNEELETAKEELQSANEELTTVNDEMQTRNTETINLNNDLSNLLASVDIPIVMVGPDGIIRRFTPKAGKTLKLIPTDVGRPIGDIKPNIQLPDLDQLVSEVMETMSMKEIEAQDKQGCWYHLQVRPYRTVDNKIDGAVIALLDIDSLKRNAEALKKAADDLKKAHDDAATIIEAQPIPLLVIDSAQRVKLANDVFYERFEVSRPDTEGRLLSELGSGQWKLPQLQKLIETTLHKGTRFDGFELEYDFPRIGQKAMILSSRKVQLAGSGEIAALLAIEDVTARKRSEHELQASEEKYRNLVASAYDGIMVVRRDGSIEFANSQLEKQFGYDAGELLNRQYDLLIADRDRQKHSGYHDQYMKKPAQREMGKGLNLFGRRKDGTEFPIDVSLSPFKSRSDVLVNCLVRDITTFKKIEVERSQLLVREKTSREEAEKANRIKDEFLATLSHELRTPLTTILSWSQMLQTGKLDAEKTKRGNQIVEQSARAQGQLIDDLLDISRIQAGKLNLTVQEVDPSKVIAGAIESTRSLAASKSIQIETTIDPSIKHIFVDPARLQQILWNLITNSIKFSSQGGRVWVTLDRIPSTSGERIRIQVRDNGKGIKPEFLPIVFERFTQVDSTSTRAYGGLGLGLAIVRKLAEMHEGTVAVESAGEGKGATFIVCLPVEPNVKINMAEAEAEAEAEAQVTLRGLRVLVVDDEPNAREVFAVMLQSFGAEVKTAESVSQALAIFEDFRPDVLVSDIAMPGEDGYSLIAKIRAMKSKLGQTPALALTAYAGREDVQRTHLAGFQAHVAKPVDANRLALAIARLAGRK